MIMVHPPGDLEDAWWDFPDPCLYREQKEKKCLKQTFSWTYFYSKSIIWTEAKLNMYSMKARQYKLIIYTRQYYWGCFWFGLTLLPWLIFSAIKAFCISMVIALSTLPDEIFLCDFCKWSLRELLLRPASFPQIGHTFIAGFLCCHSIEAFPCSFRSKSKRIFANPSLGCALRWTLFSLVHASNRVKFLKNNSN